MYAFSDILIVCSPAKPAKRQLRFAGTDSIKHHRLVPRTATRNHMHTAIGNPKHVSKQPAALPVGCVVHRCGLQGDFQPTRIGFGNSGFGSSRMHSYRKDGISLLFTNDNHLSLSQVPWTRKKRSWLSGALLSAAALEIDSCVSSARSTFFWS